MEQAIQSGSISGPLSLEDITRGYGINISQGVQHFPWTKGEIGEERWSCFGTNSMWYSYAYDCALTPDMHFWVQGFPKDIDYTMLSALEKRELAGNSFHLASFATAAYAVYADALGAWWRQ